MAHDHLSPRWRFFAVWLLGGAILAGGVVVPMEHHLAAASSAQSEINLIISADPGAPAGYAVPDFVALTNDRETIEVARIVGDVLWDDLSFEREFELVPRDTYGSIPRATGGADVPFDRWSELGADAVIVGTVRRDGDRMQVAVRLFNVRSHEAVFSREYTGSAANPRRFAHLASDELHQQQRGLRGVAQTKLAFSSDRDGEQVVGTVEDREVKEIYIADYDGANPQRITRNQSLNTFPVWTPDTRALLYTSWVRGYRELFLVKIYEGIREEPTRTHEPDRYGFRPQSALGAVSPDGKRVVFESSRSGNSELYIMNIDGSNVFRLTNHPGADITPTWNPQGTQIAFTSDRRGRPQIYLIGADGTNLTALTFEQEADRATWSPLGNEIAYTARTEGSNDIKIMDLSTRQVRQLTFAGSNESPAFAPNGRHIAFMSNRTGRMQIFTIGRDGRGERQVTRNGSNYTPNWSN